MQPLVWSFVVTHHLLWHISSQKRKKKMNWFSLVKRISISYVKCRDTEFLSIAEMEFLKAESSCCMNASLPFASFLSLESRWGCLYPSGYETLCYVKYGPVLSLFFFFLRKKNTNPVLNSLFLCVIIQDHSSLSNLYFLKFACTGKPESVGMFGERKSWITELREFSLVTAVRQKSPPNSQSLENLFTGVVCCLAYLSWTIL